MDCSRFPNNKFITRLTFGVPLEDIFLNVEVHPSLKNLCKEILLKRRFFHGVGAKEKLRNYKIPPQHESCLKDCLTWSKPIEVTPVESLLWILRHFLESLPIALLPRYTDSQYYVWLKLSDWCKIVFAKCFDNRRTCDRLNHKISLELLKLPSVNFLLIGYIVKFLRSLTIICDKGCNKISIFVAKILVQYFSESMFVRPCTQEFKSKVGKKYQSLLLYIIIRWQKINYKCTNLALKSYSELTIKNSDYFINIPEMVDKSTYTEMIDKSTHTDFIDLRLSLETILEEYTVESSPANNHLNHSYESHALVSTEEKYTTMHYYNTNTQESSSQTQTINYKDCASQTNTYDFQFEEFIPMLSQTPNLITKANEINAEDSCFSTSTKINKPACTCGQTNYKIKPFSSNSLKYLNTYKEGRISSISNYSKSDNNLIKDDIYEKVIESENKKTHSDSICDFTRDKINDYESINTSLPNFNKDLHTPLCLKNNKKNSSILEKLKSKIDLIKKPLRKISSTGSDEGDNSNVKYRKIRPTSSSLF